MPATLPGSEYVPAADQTEIPASESTEGETPKCKLPVSDVLQQNIGGQGWGREGFGCRIPEHEGMLNPC